MQLFLCHSQYLYLSNGQCCAVSQLMPECLCRPGVLGGSMGNYPWLADSWPTTNLVHTGKEAVSCCTANHDTAERYYNGRMLLRQNSLLGIWVVVLMHWLLWQILLLS